VARTLGLEQLLSRMPRQLSGGQRQRVAMGRAIVRNPKVFLFDEPLSNLDAALRVHMRTEIRKLHERLRATSVYVTHDQIEAMTMADHVVVLRAGQVEQQGAPLDLYHRPANKFVAGFIGSPSMNFIEAVIGADGRSAQFGGGTPQTLDIGRTLPVGSAVWLGLRPEHLRLQGGARGIRGVVDSVETTGSMTFVAVRVDGIQAAMLVSHAGVSALRNGEALSLDIASEHIHVFDRKTEHAL
jgi:multiple sugar transport system ATP-binding protein